MSHRTVSGGEGLEGGDGTYGSDGNHTLSRKDEEECEIESLYPESVGSYGRGR